MNSDVHSSFWEDYLYCYIRIFLIRSKNKFLMFFVKKKHSDGLMERDRTGARTSSKKKVFNKSQSTHSRTLNLDQRETELFFILILLNWELLGELWSALESEYHI